MADAYGLLLIVTCCCGGLVKVSLALAEERLCPRSCDCYNDGATIDCSQRSLVSLPPVHRNVLYLYLEDNQLNELSKSAFRDASGLYQLVLSRNDIVQLQSSTFCGLERLQELNIDRNMLQELIVDSLPECQISSLKELNLAHNFLAVFPRNLSLFASGLEILDLSYNEIRSLAVDDSYFALRDLRQLDLRHNPIHEISAGDLRVLRSIPLEIVNLAECNVVRIDETALQGMHSITSFTLSDNGLAQNTFENIFSVIGANNSLLQLDISGNAISELTAAMIGTFRKMVILRAACCKIRYIESKLFSLLKNLETLHLEGNELVTIDGLSSLAALKRLQLRDNRLSSVNLSNLFRLKSVDISHNALEEVPREWLTQLDTVQLVNLSHNLIASIDRCSFTNLSIVSTLDLSHNRLQTLHEFGLDAVAFLDVSNNLISGVQEESFVSIHRTLNALDLKHNNLSSLVIAEQFVALRFLDLSHNKLQSRRNREQVFSINAPLLQLLDLSANDISELGIPEVGTLHSLRTLDLSRNSIDDIRQVIPEPLKTLTKLALSGNHIRHVDVSLLDELQTLKELDISDNPYSCTCDIRPFLVWLNASMRSINIVDLSDPASYACHSPDTEQGRGILTYHAANKGCDTSAATRWRWFGDHTDVWVLLGTVIIVSVIVLLTFLAVLRTRHCRFDYCVEFRILPARRRNNIYYREVSDREAIIDGSV